MKNSQNLSPNDLRNSCQVQWWYIHGFYTNSSSFAALSLVNSSLEQTHIDKHRLLFLQSVPYLEICALWIKIPYDSMILTTDKKLFSMP